MMIKTLDNVYINMEDFSGFTIGYLNDSDLLYSRYRPCLYESFYGDFEDEYWN